MELYEALLAYQDQVKDTNYMKEGENFSPIGLIFHAMMKSGNVNLRWKRRDDSTDQVSFYDLQYRKDSVDFSYGGTNMPNNGIIEAFNLDDEFLTNVSFWKPYQFKVFLEEGKDYVSNSIFRNGQNPQNEQPNELLTQE